MFGPPMGQFDVSFVLRISASPWHSLKFYSEGVCFRRLPDLCCVFLTNSEGTKKLVRICMRTFSMLWLEILHFGKQEKIYSGNRKLYQISPRVPMISPHFLFSLCIQ